MKQQPMRHTLIILTLLSLFLATAPLLSAQGEYTFYALSADKNVKEPVYLCSLNEQNGEMNVVKAFGGVVAGNYYALSADRKQLLVTSKNTALDQGGVVQYSVAEDGSLSRVKDVLKKGDLPCHVSFTPDMEYVLSANYADDEILLYSFKGNEISPIIDQVVKPDGSKGHYIHTDPSGKYVYAVFLGLNKVFIYTIENDRFKENGQQPFFSLPDGYGPRHMAFHPKKQLVYIVNETIASVTACTYDPETGALHELQTISMLPPGFKEWNIAAAIRVHPNGQFLYASNRGHNSIAVFRIQDDGTLIFVERETEGINFPRDFNISPDGKFMVVGNQRGNSVMSFTIHPDTGELVNTGNALNISQPLAFEFIPPQSTNH
jgi:6-phosphogluconolactonase